MCSLTTECVRLLQNVFAYYRMCSITTECVLLLQNVFSYYRICSLMKARDLSLQRTKSIPATECVLFLQNVFPYYRMRSLTQVAFNARNQFEEGEIVAVKLPEYCLGFEATGWAAKYARLALAQVAR